MDQKYLCVTRNVQNVGHDGGSIYDVHKVFMALQNGVHEQCTWIQQLT